MRPNVLQGATALTLAILLAACGGGGSATSSSTTTPASSSPSSTKASGPQLTATPASGLKSPETLKLSATGFTPDEALVVTECANKGTKTEAGDCNLTGLKNVTSDSAGHVDVDFSVTRGPFGSNKIVCSTPTACLVTVTQATPNPTQDATAIISFG
ncbi:MAG: neocarzinostatin apoprotein domain-containing protein [Acidimicrobiales bacterium]